ncbi:MAG: 50S ribosomal protein L21, partial [Bacteroidota bacterium]
AAGAAAANIVPDIDYAANPDDLKLLWGIGPKIEQLLNSAGIYTFRQVAAGSVEEFRKILNESGNPRLAQIANEESWSQQAELARDGEWDALKELQAKLNWRSGGQIS